MREEIISACCMCAKQQNCVKKNLGMYNTYKKLVVKVLNNSSYDRITVMKILHRAGLL